MKTHDAIVIGAGVIGLSLAIALCKRGLSVLVIERGEAGREASHAAAGMLVRNGDEIPPALRPLAEASADLYPEFVHELEDESQLKIDFRRQGTILFSARGEFSTPARAISCEELTALEPLVRLVSGSRYAAYVEENSVDPRTLMRALLQAAKHRGVDIASGSQAETVWVENGRTAGVRTQRISYPAPVVVNCAGAWAGQIAPYQFPVRPVKGQMLAVVGGPPMKHVIRGDDVYLVPRSDGKIVIGSTLEDAGFNKQVDVNTIETLFQAAVDLVPEVASARQHEAWAGLRPGTPDGLPILGETATPRYFVASGHYRDGILLAPVTAEVLSDLVLGKSSNREISRFTPFRFPQSKA